MTKILIVGGGGREHALAWRCVHEGHEVLATPGNDGIARLPGARCLATADDHGAVVELARREAVELAIVGPEAPLVDGLADALRRAEIPTLGPGASAAQLEGSKAVAKQFMARHGVPTARHVTVRELDAGLAALREFDEAPVVKASGLAAGKGVVVAETHAEAEAALRACLEGGRFGAAGSEVVLEQRLRGQEASFFVLTDGEHAATFEPCQDHKRIGEGDTGPNTGGMGAYCPAPIVDAAVRERVAARIVAPTLAGLREDGRPFVGVLFIGLMIDPAGDPQVIEYNVRFGDPEVQPLMLGLRTPLVPRLLAAATGSLADEHLPGDPAATVILASAGYPERSTKGVELVGLEAAMARADADPELALFHAGTRRDPQSGLWTSNGGRVLGACARGSDLRAALSRAYDLLGTIELEGGQFRRDIGHAVLGS
ncbi:phosphoribosylamine--glycine ligase [Pseudenhygromyxa sp. WMMC2535]|uniref:phosphoribosylamine--glycine ligase n=1 Tax=Pseudenhygromyxa sp. WMMC2535 TaxID=2712867 RepID=UPI0015549096|nr:phosphoribosylamine--glycine ligase [Pseudenhygromyxa sp. WMMC2535]NVB42065.1 phosphoribosylamine--glycine ligase [Pseudenhygromyxa sp. WMMC2535]